MSLPLRFETVLESFFFEGKVGTRPAGVTFVDDDGGEVTTSYLGALEASRGYAAALRRRGVERGEPVLVLVPTSGDFLHCFLGLMLAGAIPSALAMPVGFADLDDFAERARRVTAYLGARRVIVAPGLRGLLEARLSGTDIVATDELAAEAASGTPLYEPIDGHASDLAFIQCTSGSTGTPKGVMLSHENLVANVYQIGWALDIRARDVFVSWLPLYHDMGLIAILLTAVYWNAPAVLLSPFRFMKRPATWLETIARHRGTITSAPNFAYGYVSSRAKGPELEGLDLSSLRVAACGAEPIDRRTLARFVERFRAHGLRPEAPFPCYGLAEATVAVAFHAPLTPVRWDRVSRDALATRGETLAAPEGDPDAVEIVSCGRAIPETRMRIVDDSWRDLPDGRVGRLLVSGPQVMKGYFALPEVTAATIREGWLDTGDLAYLRDGEVFIAGRIKDLVVIRGRKYLPSDFEWAADEVPGVRRGAIVAFGVYDPALATEALHLVCETDVTAPEEQARLREAVRARVAERTGVLPAAVELVPRDSVPKTSSGKLQRSRAKALFGSGAHAGHRT